MKKLIIFLLMMLPLSLFAQESKIAVVNTQEVIQAMPEFADMQKKMTASRDCKRLIDPNACSDTCVKGFVYDLDGGTYKKCRNDGMFFLLTNETAEHIAELICAEVTVRQSASQPQDS